MTSPSSMHADIDQWFGRYFNSFVEIAAGKADTDDILRYWSVPLHSSTPQQSKWLMSRKEVVLVLRDMQEALKKMGYTHTLALDRSITVYHAHAARVEAIMSRRRGDDSEVDRAVVTFDIRCAEDGWTIISTSLCPTQATTLKDGAFSE